MSAPTNQELAEQIDEVNKAGQLRHKSVLTTINKLRAEFHELYQPMHDYLVGQKAIKENDKTRSSNSSINIDPKVWDIIKWLVLIIGAIVGAKFV